MKEALFTLCRCIIMGVIEVGFPVSLAMALDSGSGIWFLTALVLGIATMVLFIDAAIEKREI